MSSIAPLGKIEDWFYIVEYQQRGSPHIHMLICYKMHQYLELMKMTMSHLLLIKSLPAIYQMMSLSYLTLLIDKHTDTPTLVEKKSKKEC